MAAELCRTFKPVCRRQAVAGSLRRVQGLNSLGKLAGYGMPHQEELPGLPRGQFIAWNKQSGGVLRGRLF